MADGDDEAARNSGSDLEKTLKSTLVHMAAVATPAVISGSLTGDYLLALASAGIQTGISAVHHFFEDLGKRDWKGVEREMIKHEVLLIAREQQRLEENVGELEEAGIPPTPADVANVYDEFHKVWRDADPQKKRILGQAFANSFDPALYRDGVYKMLFKLVDELTYGDLRLLAVALRDKDKGRCARPMEDSFSSEVGNMHGTIAMYHLRTLERLELVKQQDLRYENVQGATVLANKIVPTPLAEKLAELIGEGILIDELPNAEPEPAG